MHLTDFKNILSQRDRAKRDAGWAPDAQKKENV